MRPDFNKYTDSLIPVIVQDNQSNKVLMLGYMNEESYEKTITGKKVTFYSRSRRKLWTKGETSGNYLFLISMLTDCDNDCLLLKVSPAGPVCHTGADTCFGETNNNKSFLPKLEEVIRGRKQSPVEGSYTSQLFQKGINKIAQKVGEEAVELIIEAKDNNKLLFVNEAADLLYHYLILLQAKGLYLADIEKVLETRHR